MWGSEYDWRELVLSLGSKQCYSLGSSSLFIFNIFIHFYIMYMGVLLACNPCAPHVCNAHGGQQRALDPLELVLHLVGAGNAIPVLCKSSQCFLIAELSLQLLFSFL